MSAPTPLIGLTRAELTALFASHDFAPLRAKQVWLWMYGKGVESFEAMTTIAKDERGRMAELFSLARPRVANEQISSDTTRKWLVELHDKNQVESVFIPDVTEDRGALCISSQVGCTLSCSFCHTGTMKLVRNLTAHDIVGQVMIARDRLGEWARHSRDRMFTNIVLMGMGEPLYNYEQVAKAMHIVMDHEGIALSKRKITLSTSGVVPMMERCGRELGVGLAISLHAVTDELRNELVPLNKKYPIKELLQACRDYPAASNARRITFEYVMLKGVNDSDAEAHELVRLLKDIPAKVNLIPFNPWPGSAYETSSGNRQHAFARILMDNGFSSPIRTPRGRDILAACGQLKSDSERKKGEKVALYG